ncbi:disulfide bond formation protein B [Bradyrhizobium sp. STM 3562]|uniref:disulfide bond formation protein B n=1 Tax=Bradyrhizobium sp. STM 3562 TaxID=578924 RepID=UPI00388FCFBD
MATENALTSARESSSLNRYPSQKALLGVGLIALIVITSALILQYGFGYEPCELCLQQRWPYYLGVPFALALSAGGMALPRTGRILCLFLLGSLFAYGAVLGVYHAGAEWGFWLEGTSCSAAHVHLEAQDLLAELSTAHVVSCTDPRIRVLGLSLAGWNVVVMVLLIGFLLAGLRSEFRA